MILFFINNIGIFVSVIIIFGVMDEVDKMQIIGLDNVYEVVMWRLILLMYVEYLKGLCLGYIYVFILCVISVKL